MSSISSISGGVNLSQFYQSISSTNSSPATNGTTSADPLATPGSGQRVRGGHRHGHHGGGNSEIFGQLQSAVNSALQSATQQGSDPNQAIQTAIQKIFQNNQNSASPANQSSSTTDAEAGQANTPASTNNNPALQKFLQTLQTAGINGKQFQKDFLAAVQSAQNGTVNPAQAFQSIPAGSIIDAIG